MKKFLPLLLLFTALCLTSRAESIEYGMGDGHIDGVGAQTAGYNYSAAIEVPQQVARAIAGNKVTNVTIGFGSGTNKIVNIYLTYDLGAEPFYTQEGRVSVNKMNSFDLTTPYVIEGKRFYIGYTYHASTSTGRHIGFDNNPAAASPYFDNLAVWVDGTEPQWSHMGSRFGSLALTATIEGEKFPAEFAVPGGLVMPEFTRLDTEFTREFSFRNLSTEPVSSVEVTSAINGAAPVAETVTFAEPVAPGALATMEFPTVSNIKTEDFGVTMAVTKVNGRDNIWNFAQSSGSIVSSNSMALRTVVIEEYTGLGCGYCPVGYVGMETMNELHPEGYIGIAVHNYSYPSDVMRCSDYLPWCNMYISAAPSATANRSPLTGVFQPSPTGCEAAFLLLSKMVNAAVAIDARFSDDTRKSVDVNVTTTFGSALSGLEYGIALVVTEDNLGPYNQANNYATIGDPCYGFENLGNRVPLIFNDVARSIVNWQGEIGSVPATVEEETAYPYSRTLAIPEPMSSTNNYGNFNIIALLIDRKTGEIVNAAKCRIAGTTPDARPSGIEEAGADIAGADIRIELYAGGIVSVEGDDAVATAIHAADGSLRASFGGAGSATLTPGVYIVSVTDKAGNLTTRKVAVR